MKSDLAIAALIRSRMTELGLSRGELSKRLGSINIAKGIRRIDALCDGDLEGTKQFLDMLPQALEASPEGRIHHLRAARLRSIRGILMILHYSERKPTLQSDAALRLLPGSRLRVRDIFPFGRGSTL
jgi:hypothetical protein